MTKTATARAPRPTTPRGVNFPDLRQKLASWHELRKQEKQAKKDAEALKEKIFKPLVEKFGKVDEKGSLIIDLDQPVGPIVAIKNQRSVSTTINAEAAESILRKKGLWKEPYVVMTPVIDYDAVRGAIFERLITRAESNRIFGSNESFSFIAVDASGKAVAG